MMWSGHDTGWAGWSVMGVSMLAFWGLVTWGLVMLYRMRPAAASDTPEQVLARRYAAGELDADAFAAACEVLSHQRALAKRT